MKYLGVAYACVAAVVAAAAIYLLEAPSFVRPSAPATAAVVGKLPDGRTPSSVADSSYRHESSSSPAEQAAREARQAKWASLEKALPETQEPAPESLAAENEPHLLPQEQASAKAPDAEQTKLAENKLTEVQTATDVPKAGQAKLEGDGAESAPPATNSSIGAATPDIIVAIATATGSGAEVNADLQTSRAPAADPIAPSRNEALLPHQNSGADETPKSEQARVEENSTESAEPTVEYRTASAVDDFDYSASANAAAKADFSAALPNEIGPIVVLGPVLRHEPLTDAQKTEQAKLEEDTSPAGDLRPSSFPSKHAYLAYYVYAEHPPDRKPADLALDALKNVPVGTPLEEIKRAAAAFGLDYNFMKAVAKVESDFDPKQRTGSYIGLFQLSHYEFARYGSGDILNPRDNAIAAAYKFINEGTQFEWDTHKNPTYSDLYLIHQQGWQGAAEHVSHPEWVAWKSMCATDEGKEKGEKWCKRAVWQNTLPAIKHLWKSVENLPSSAFVTMWRERIDRLYSRYSEMITGKQDVDSSRPEPKPPESGCAKAGGCLAAGKKVADISRHQSKQLESTCAKGCRSQDSGKSVSNKSLRQRVSHARRRLVPGGNARNVHAFVGVGVHHS
jgi:hypothetical protein